MATIRAQEGPQRAFNATPADIAIFGGSAGPGKSWSLVYEPLRWVDLPGFTGIIFRRLRPQLVGGGSVWEESEKLYPLRGGRARRGNVLDWRFPSGAQIEFSHMQYEADRFTHKSKQYAYIGIDEISDFTEAMIWYLLSRNRSLSGVRPYFRGATNPDPDCHVRTLIDWWIGKDGYPVWERSGVIRWVVRIEDDLHWADDPEELYRKFAHLPRKEVRPKSVTFVPALLEHNPILADGDPDYRANLKLLHEIDRLMLEAGNWNVRPKAGDFFKPERAKIVDAAPADLIEIARGWDLAATPAEPSPADPDPDWTVGVKIGRARNGLVYVLDVIRKQIGPLDVEQMILNTANQDGQGCKVAIWQDPAQAGKFQVQHFTRLLHGFVVEVQRTSRDKVTFAKPFSTQWLAGNVILVRGEWNNIYLRELEGFPSKSSKAKDDQVDASSVAYMKISASLSGIAALEALTRM
jgi:predicted phage terminase large subunit-like protein